MKETAALKLMRAYLARYPNHGQTEGAAELWPLLLSDVDEGLGWEAVADLLARGVEPHPDVIRRWVADRCGVGSRPFDALGDDAPRLLAWWAVADAGGNRTAAASTMARLVLAGADPGLVEVVGRALGGAQAGQVLSGDEPGVMRGQLRRMYDEHRARASSAVAPGGLAGVTAEAASDAEAARRELVAALDGFDAALARYRADPEEFRGPSGLYATPQFDADLVVELTARVADLTVRRHALARADAAGALGLGR